jgi:glycosyltransferase involved in cell wall biosynthesis
MINLFFIVHNHSGARTYADELLAHLASQKKKMIRRQLGFNEKERLILFVGLIEERKGIKHLLQAFNNLSKKYTNIRLVIAGDGDYKEVFERTKNCSGRITLTGKVPREEVCLLYQIADIGVIPSVFEQCSYVALEMLKYGLPVVVSAVSGLKELYIDHKNALLVPLVKTDDKSLKLEVIEKELEMSIDMLLSNDDRGHKCKKTLGRRVFSPIYGNGNNGNLPTNIIISWGNTQVYTKTPG